MKKHLTTVGLFIAVISLIGSVYFGDELFAIAFLVNAVHSIAQLFDASQK